MVFGHSSFLEAYLCYDGELGALFKFFISIISHFALSVDGECFVFLNPLKGSWRNCSGVLSSLCCTLYVHCLYRKTVCCLIQNEKMLCFALFFFYVVLSDWKDLVPLLHLKTWVFGLCNSVRLGLSSVQFCLANIWSDSSFI